MKKLRWYEENTSTIGNMQMIEVEANPNTTLDELRARFPQLFKTITERNVEFKNKCEQKAAVDYGGSYERWLEDVLKECGDAMAQTTDLYTYIHANETRKICLAELARLAEPHTQAPIDTAAGNNTGGDKITPPEAEKQHFSGYKSDKAYTDLLEELQKAGLVPQHTTAAAWLWVCKGIPLPADEQFEPVNWLGTQNKLGLLIETLFGGISEAPTKACFTVKGKKPNVDSMRVERSKIKDNTSSNSKEEPKTHKALLKILAVWNAQSK